MELSNAELQLRLMALREEIQDIEKTLKYRDRNHHIPINRSAVTGRYVTSKKKEETE